MFPTEAFDHELEDSLIFTCFLLQPKWGLCSQQKPMITNWKIVGFYLVFLLQPRWGLCSQQKPVTTDWKIIGFYLFFCYSSTGACDKRNGR